MSKLYLQNLKVSLEELADRGFQERAWFATGGPEVSSFSEMISQAFDDTGLSDVMDKGALEAVVGSDAARALEELNKAISRVDESLSPAELIDNPAMQKVRASAQRALEALNQSSTKMQE